MTEKSIPNPDEDPRSSLENDPIRAEHMAYAGDLDRSMAVLKSNLAEIFDKYEQDIYANPHDPLLYNNIREEVLKLITKFSWNPSFERPKEDSPDVIAEAVLQTESMINYPEYYGSRVEDNKKIAKSQEQSASSREFWTGALYDHPEVNLKLNEVVGIVNDIIAYQRVVDLQNAKKSEMEELIAQGGGTPEIEANQREILEIVYSLGEEIAKLKSRLGPLEDYLDRRPKFNKFEM